MINIVINIIAISIATLSAYISLRCMHVLQKYINDFTNKTSKLERTVENVINCRCSSVPIIKEAQKRSSKKKVGQAKRKINAIYKN